MIALGLAAAALAGWTVLGFATTEPLPATYASQPTVGRQVIVVTVCTYGKVEKLVKTFIRAFNNGDLERIDRIFCYAARSNAIIVWSMSARIR